MATTSKQDADFIRDVVNSDMLSNAMDWIAANMTPEDVFDKDELESWAEENGYVKP